MLTKDLLQFRVQKGRVYPGLIAKKGQQRDVAEALLARMTNAVGEPRGDLEADLSALATGHSRPRIAKGLVKLILDRAEFEEADPQAETARTEWLAEAESVRGKLLSGASFEDYEQALGQHMDLPEVRDRLYRDLPGRRPLVAFKPITAEQLIDRYDLAQVQGLLLFAQRLDVCFADGDTPELRRILRWMRFNRLVTDVNAGDEGWRLTIEGPATVIDSAKKYGLQLASFFLVVPTVARWSAEAEIKMPRRPASRLEISHETGLKPGLDGGAGHVPPEMRTVLDRWSDPDWALDPSPPPRSVGVQQWCVPDLAATRAGQTVAIELFHGWHHGALPLRLKALADRPQPDLMLGVERKLARKATVELTGPQIFEFSGFPTERVLKRALASWWATVGAQN